MSYELRVLLVGLQPLDSAMRLSTHGAQEKRRKAPSEELRIKSYALNLYFCKVKHFFCYMQIMARLFFCFGGFRKKMYLCIAVNITLKRP